MRLITAFLVFALPALAMAAEMDSSAATGKLACESQTRPGDNMDVTCPLEANGAPQRYRFRVDFSGSHDDTTASIAATLDGAPLACGDGSKTSTMGEDGEVSLECRFSITGKAGTKRMLAVAIAWDHAQYMDFAVTAE